MHPICATCGTQFAATVHPPERCPICDDERQFVGWAGQRWTTLDGLRATHRLAVRPQADGLLGLGIEPHFAIGQRALLVPAGATLAASGGGDAPPGPAAAATTCCGTASA